MIHTNTKSTKFTRLISILIPVLITQISVYAMSFFDIMMSGHMIQPVLRVFRLEALYGYQYILA